MVPTAESILLSAVGLEMRTFFGLNRGFVVIRGAPLLCPTGIHPVPRRREGLGGCTEAAFGRLGDIRHSLGSLFGAD